MAVWLKRSKHAGERADDDARTRTTIETLLYSGGFGQALQTVILLA